MSDPAASGDRKPPNFQVAIRLEWDEADDVPILYANQVQVSHGGPEFFVVFGVVVPPTNPNELPDALKIQPQVRLVIARDAMPSMVQALTDNLQRYQQSQSQGSGRKAAPTEE
jgi:hypothetical protein